MTTRVLLARHGDTEASKDGRFAGAADVPLSKEGRIHATELGVRLSRYPINAIYASPLRRARDTAEYIARVHALEVTPMPEFREVNHGKWDGMTREEIIERYTMAQVERYDSDPYHFAPEGGESGEQVLFRAAPALERLVRAHPDQTILIVSHKTTNRLLISHFVGLDPCRFRDTLAQRPACLNILQFTNERQAQLLLLNDIGHYAMSDDSTYSYAV